LNLPKKTNVPSIGPDGDAWLNQTIKTQKAFDNRIGMEGNLGMMTFRRQGCRKANPIT
jgi:hypothetical protein